MILHIADDEKFIDVAIEQFENVAPNKNIYLIKIPRNDYKLKYIKRLDKVLALPFESTEYKNILKSKYDAIVFHNLSLYKLIILNDLPSNIHIHWMAWGTDIYSLYPINKEIILPITKKYLLKNTFNGLLRTNLKIYYPSLWNLFNIVLTSKLSFNYKIRQLAKKINSVSTVVDTEYPIIKKYFGSNIEYLPFRYGSIEHFFPDIENSEIYCNEDNILIANSSSPTCNHFDTFEILKNAEIINNIFVPLSYGNSKYATIVKKEGLRIFGEKFVPLTDFLPLIDYKQIIVKCGIVLMNHLRQRAMGNIIMSLWLGAKIYMQPLNPVYSYLSGHGIKIYDINEFLVNNDNLNHQDLAQINRPIIKLLYSKDKILNMTHNLVKTLNN